MSRLVALIFVALLLFGVGFSNGQQCGKNMGIGIWASGGMLVAILLIMAMVYVVAGLEITRSLWEPNYIRNIIQEKLGEIGLNFLIVLFFALLFTTNIIGGKDFIGLANTLPSAFSSDFLASNLPLIIPQDMGSGVYYSDLYGAISTQQKEEILLEDRPLYLRSARYYVYFMRTMGMFTALMLNMFSGMFNLMSSLTMHLRIKVIGFSLSLGTALGPILHMISFLVTGTNIALGHWILQGFVLDFIECFSLELILPLGVLMRLFAPTKGFGDVLVAFVIGMLVIYPLMLNVNAMHAKITYGDDTPDRNLSPGALISSPIAKTTTTIVYLFTIQNMLTTVAASLTGNHTSDDVLQGMVSKAWAWGASKFSTVNRIKNFFDKFSGISNYLKNGLVILMWLALYWYIYTLVSGALFSVYTYIVNFVVIMSIVWPAINIYVTLLSIKAIAKFLGTEFNLAGIARML